MTHAEIFFIQTQGFNDILDITERVTPIARPSKMQEGLGTVFCPGSTASITTIEHEPGALEDLKHAVEKLVPSNIPYEHDERSWRWPRLLACPRGVDETFSHPPAHPRATGARNLAAGGLHGF